MTLLPVLFITMMVYIVGLVVTMCVGLVVHLILKTLDIHSSRVYTWIGFCLPTLFIWQQVYFRMEGLLAGVILGAYDALWAYTFANYMIDLAFFKAASDAN